MRQDFDGLAGTVSRAVETSRNNGRFNVVCLQWRTEIQFGRDLVAVEKGVNGPRGFVPLGETLMFCSNRSVGECFDGPPE